MGVLRPPLGMLPSHVLAQAAPVPCVCAVRCACSDAGFTDTGCFCTKWDKWLTKDSYWNANGGVTLPPDLHAWLPPPASRARR